MYIYIEAISWICIVINRLINRKTGIELTTVKRKAIKVNDVRKDTHDAAFFFKNMAIKFCSWIKVDKSILKQG